MTHSVVGRLTRRDLLLALLISAGVLGWFAYATVTSTFLEVSTLNLAKLPAYAQYDWHVYAAGARDLVDHQLYRTPLRLDDLPLPVSMFNLPPMSAAMAVPLLPLPLDLAGTIWQLLGAASVAVAMVALASMVGWRWPPVTAGILGGSLALAWMSYWHGLLLGTNNYLVLGLVAGFAWCYANRRDRAAGILLALSIATKLWPLPLLLLPLRDRRGLTIRWSVAVLAAQAAFFLIWLGPDVLPDFIRAMGTTGQASIVLGFSALRDLYPWWPAWGGSASGLVLAALPLRGRVGIGVLILSGLSFIPNLWVHYLPTVVFAGVLILADVAALLGPKTSAMQSPAPA